MIARRPFYWTAADQAELVVLARELVDGIYEHLERCAVCSLREGFCDHVRAGFDVFLDWLERRRELSFAAAMRAWQDQELLVRVAARSLDGKEGP